MSSVVLTRGDDGKLHGMGQKGERAYARFLKRLQSLAVGETLQFHWWEPRSPAHHRLFFRKLHALADRQEVFEDEDDLRAWLTVGAGYCRLQPGPNGQLVAVPLSIAWHSLDEVAFGEVHQRVNGFLWSEHARRFLWPHLSNAKSYELIEQFMMEFDR